LAGDEGLGLHQDGTVRKAGGAMGNAGPSENGQRAAAYMRSGLNNEHGLYGGGSGHDSYDPLTGRHDSARGGHRTSGQIRDFSNFDPLRTARDRALSWGVGFLNSSAGSLLSVRAAYAADRSRTYSTDSRGEFLVRLDGAAVGTNSAFNVRLYDGHGTFGFVIQGLVACRR
jgi:hypothetical protein